MTARAMLLALLFSVAIGAFGAYTPEQVAQIERTPVGETLALVVRSGDCNTCTCAVQRVSDTKVQWGTCLCTTLACLSPAHRFKPAEEKTK